MALQHVFKFCVINMYSADVSGPHVVGHHVTDNSQNMALTSCSICRHFESLWPTCFRIDQVIKSRLSSCPGCELLRTVIEPYGPGYTKLSGREFATLEFWTERWNKKVFFKLWL